MSGFTLPAVGATQMYGGHAFRGVMGGWGWGFGILGMLFWLALIVLVVVLVWRLLERGGRNSGPGREGGHETALEILKKRYARGEIDRDEFERMKRDLS